MQRHRWEIEVIWFLTVHLCPIGPRLLDTCSLNIRTIRMWDHESPSQSLSHIYFLGPQSSLGLYYYPVLMPCFTALFTIARGAPVLFRNKCGMLPRYRQAQSHFRVPGRL